MLLYNFNTLIWCAELSASPPCIFLLLNINDLFTKIILTRKEAGDPPALVKLLNDPLETLGAEHVDTEEDVGTWNVVSFISGIKIGKSNF